MQQAATSSCSSMFISFAGPWSSDVQPFHAASAADIPHVLQHSSFSGFCARTGEHCPEGMQLTSYARHLAECACLSQQACDWLCCLGLRDCLGSVCASVCGAASAMNQSTGLISIYP